MNKICLLGSTGLVGQAMIPALQREFPQATLVQPKRAELDVSDFTRVREYLQTEKPAVVINCVGYTNVDAPETDEAEAQVCWLLNRDLVRVLAETCQQIGAILVHFSTDYVFAGTNSNGYSEDATCGAPLNIYGESKKAGEQAILDAMTRNYYILRTSWLFGPGKKNFVTAMLELADKLPELKIVSDQHGKPTYTIDIATRVVDMLKQNVPAGTYHVVNEGETTWYEFAQNIFAIFGKDVTVRPITAEEFGRPAKRPMYSSLKTTKLPPLRSHLDALKAFKESLS